LWTDGHFRHTLLGVDLKIGYIALLELGLQFIAQIYIFEEV